MPHVDSFLCMLLKLTDKKKTAVNEKLENLRAMIQADNADAVETAKKDLEAVWFPIAEEIYKSQAPEGGPAKIPMTPFSSMASRPPFHRV